MNLDIWLDGVKVATVPWAGPMPRTLVARMAPRVVRKFNDVCSACNRNRRRELRHMRVRARDRLPRGLGLQRFALPVMPATAYAGSLGTPWVGSQLRVWPRLVWSGVWRDGPSPWSRGAYLHVPEAGKGGVSHRVYPRDGAGYVARDAVEVGGRWWWLMEKNQRGGDL